MDERPTIPGTAEWPDVPLARAIIAVNAVKVAEGGPTRELHATDEEAASYVQLVFAACGERGIEPEDAIRLADMASSNLAQGMVGSAMAAGDPVDLRKLTHSVWLDGFLHGVATARRLWGDPDTGVVELRPEEESDDAR